MSDKRYNGWTNYETWNLALWIDNEQGSYDYWQERTREVYRSARPSISPRFTKREQAILDLCHELKAEIEDNTPEVTGFYADVLSAAISEVNWYEIVEHWINDLDEDDKDEEEDEA